MERYNVCTTEVRATVVQAVHVILVQEYRHLESAGSSGGRTHGVRTLCQWHRMPPYASKWCKSTHHGSNGRLGPVRSQQGSPRPVGRRPTAGPWSPTTISLLAAAPANNSPLGSFPPSHLPSAVTGLQERLFFSSCAAPRGGTVNRKCDHVGALRSWHSDPIVRRASLATGQCPQ